MPKTIFLPGAGGSASFWKPVSDLLTIGDDSILPSWPGLGNEPADERVSSMEDLVSLVVAEMTEPCDLVAQSMGGIVAVKAALAAPEKLRRLVLVATSGGVPTEDLGLSDWRPEYRAAFPNAAHWITGFKEDFSSSIPAIQVPTLLIWGDSDPISPVVVGERLQGLLPNAKLELVPGGDHDLAVTHAELVAELISSHLAQR